MKLRFLSPALHGTFDYLLDVSLLIVPLAAGFSDVALWLAASATAC